MNASRKKHLLVMKSWICESAQSWRAAIFGSSRKDSLPQPWSFAIGSRASRWGTFEYEKLSSERQHAEYDV